MQYISPLFITNQIISQKMAARRTIECVISTRKLCLRQYVEKPLNTSERHSLSRLIHPCTTFTFTWPSSLQCVYPLFHRYRNTTV